MIDILIPARKGSKRIKNKNTINFMGKPLFAWSVELALKLEKCNVIISTDCKIIKDYVNTNYKDVTIHNRSECSSSDKATSIDVIKEVANDNIFKSNTLLYLQPTSPLRKFETLNKLVKIAKNYNNKLVSVSKVSHPSQWIIKKDSFITNSFIKKLNNIRSQDFEEEFILNGSYFFLNLNELEASISHIQEDSFCYETPLVESIDIDNYDDLRMAEFFSQYKYEI